MDRVFAKLCESSKAPTRTLEEWRTLLSTNYRRKYKRDDSVCEVRVVSA